MPSPVNLAVGIRNFFHRFAVLFKLAVIGVLLLLLLIPLTLVRSTLDERLGRRNEAVTSISAAWGGDQTVAGPVLKVPYQYRETVTERGENAKPATVEKIKNGFAYFLPDTLTISGSVAPQQLHRGIYDAVVWRADCAFSGVFDLSAALRELKIPAADVRWDDAELCVIVSDLRGVREKLMLTFAGVDSEFLPGSGLDNASGIHAAARFAGVRINNAPPSAAEFSFQLALNGSGLLAFAPAGRETKARLVSSWRDPKFDGKFSPTTRDLAADGFVATWELSDYARNYPRQWLGNGYLVALAHETFGSSFLAPVDGYRSVERAVKYAVLFITLIFTAYFLFEVVARRKIHPFQYILVGMAVSLFYLGILSLSELLPFGWAYLWSASATWLMITLYTQSVLKSGRRALTVAALLAVILAFLYAVLRLQDYSLLFGTVLLFVALGAVMLVTRRVDWYNDGAADDEAARPPK